MKLNYLLIVLGFCAFAGIIGIAMNVAEPPEDPMLDRNSKKMKTWELYAKDKFADLNKASGRELEELFTDFSSITHAREFMRNERTRDFYSQFLVAVIEDSMKMDVVEAMFKAFILEITPRGILLEAIVPELGPKGRLHGILERETAGVSKRLQRQSSQGYPGEPDFRHYAAYLGAHKDVDSTPYLISHMFKIAPGEALRAMMSAQYLLPYPPLRLSNESPSVIAEIRPLLHGEHIISDFVWHRQYGIDLARDQRSKAKSELSVLSQHKKWWVRLYVAEIMQQHPELQVREVMEQLKKDKHELVKHALTQTQTLRGAGTTVDPPNTSPK